MHNDEEEQLRLAKNEQSAANALEGGNTTSCVMLARSADHWEKPYEAIFLAQKEDLVWAEVGWLSCAQLGPNFIGQYVR